MFFVSARGARFADILVTRNGLSSPLTPHVKVCTGLAQGLTPSNYYYDPSEGTGSEAALPPCWARLLWPCFGLRLWP